MPLGLRSALGFAAGFALAAFAGAFALAVFAGLLALVFFAALSTAGLIVASSLSEVGSRKLTVRPIPLAWACARAAASAVATSPMSASALARRTSGELVLRVVI